MILISCHDTLAMSPGQYFCGSRPFEASLLREGTGFLVILSAGSLPGPVHSSYRNAVNAHKRYSSVRESWRTP
ncbi:MAG TPA: hypothetical protein PLU94_02615, partial [Methanoregulaceae archaeon]|nr:hypothetical protein [Methanoregulaceae archaeon]